MKAANLGGARRVFAVVLIGATAHCPYGLSPIRAKRRNLKERRLSPSGTFDRLGVSRLS